MKNTQHTSFFTNNNFTTDDFQLQFVEEKVYRFFHYDMKLGFVDLSLKT